MTTEVLDEERVVVVGPFPIYFGNVNKAMKLRGHYHTGAVTFEYGYVRDAHGYPSFKVTNDALRRELQAFTHGIFRDATNEDVVDRMWEHFKSFAAPEWAEWRGVYWLQAIHLDVEGVLDDIGHDAGITRYSIRCRRPLGTPDLSPDGRETVAETRGAL